MPPKVQPATNLTTDAVPASCASTITPACLQALYGIPTAPATQSSNKLGVSGFIDQFAQTADLRVCGYSCISMIYVLTVGLLVDFPCSSPSRHCADYELRSPDS